MPQGQAPVLLSSIMHTLKRAHFIIYMCVLALSAGCAGKPPVKSPQPAPAQQHQAVSEQSLSSTSQDATTQPGGSSDRYKRSQQKQSAKPQPVLEPGELQPAAEKSALSIKKKEVQKLSAAKAGKPAASEEGEKQKIALDFDDADIYEVINALSDILNINYIIDPSVRGKVNIHTSGEIDKSQIFPILETIFKLNNIAAVKAGNLYKIIPIKEAKSALTEMGVGSELASLPSGDRVIIQIVPLRYIPAAEVAKVLKPFVSAGGDIQEYGKGNILIIIDTAANIQKLLGFIDIMDVDTFEQMNVSFFKVKNSDVKELAKELESLFSSSLGFSKSTDKGLGISFIPIERINYILVVSSIPGIFERVEHWITVLDAVDTGTEEQVFVYFLENAKASDMVSVLGSLYGEGPGTGGTTKQSKTPEKSKLSEQKSNRYRKTKETTTRRETGSGGGVSGAEGMLQGPIKIVTDETTNAIIIRAIPGDYAVIKETIQKLDIIPKQVLIEVLIAEVTLSGDTELGIEWALRGTSSLGGYTGDNRAETTFGLGGLGTDLAKSLNKGFTYRFDSNRLQAFLVAQASHNKLNILSCPQILAADNKEARIEVGEEVPIVTSEYVPLTTQQVYTTSRSIEYRSTGVLLTVTPRINDKGLVALEIAQEVSKAQPVVAGGIQSPTITNRKAETSMVVQNATTIVIGGLIGQETAKTISGIPFLSRIPLLGYFFSDTKNTEKKTELIILITPHVVTNINEAEIISQEFRNKVDQIKKLIKKTDDPWMDMYKR